MLTAPSTLIDDLLRLGLIHSADAVRAGRLVTALGRQVPGCDALWIEPLVADGVLTPWQAAEIYAGRLEALRRGEFILRQRLPSLGYAAGYVARDIAAGRPCQLLVAQPQNGAADCAAALRESLAALGGLAVPRVVVPYAVVATPPEVCVASQHWPGTSLADWVVQYGRFPPEAVLEIARQMVALLQRLTAGGAIHGDLGLRTLSLDRDGQIHIAWPGVRPVLRPAEGFAHADLPPEACDYLAPERVRSGAAADLHSELCACGLVWSHLLTGRPPWPGGSALGKLRAAFEGTVPDVRRLMPRVPDTLVEAIFRCTRRDPRERPTSFEELARLLGPPTGWGQRGLARCAAGRHEPPFRLVKALACRRRQPSFSVGWGALAAALLLGVGLLAWGRLGDPPPQLESANATETGAQRQSPDRDPLPPDLNQPFPPADDPHPGSSGQRAAPVKLASGVPWRRAAPGSDRPSKGSQAPPALVLPIGRTLTLDRLKLQPGQTVGGAGGRPRIEVPRQGLLITTPDVCFQNIDFVRGQSDATYGAFVRVTVPRVRFEGCTFVADARGGTAVAIEWSGGPSGRPGDAADRRGGELLLEHCVIHQVGAAVLVSGEAEAAIKMLNVLHTGPGPLVRLGCLPGRAGFVSLGLQRCTVRGADQVLECPCPAAADPSGRLMIRAFDSVFAPATGGALISFTGRQPPANLSDHVAWTGQGAVVAEEAIDAHWLEPGGAARPVDEHDLPFAGMVRSALEFAGPASPRPADSRLVRCLAPMRSDELPGIDPGLLPEAPAEPDRRP